MVILTINTPTSRMICYTCHQDILYDKNECFHSLQTSCSVAAFGFQHLFYHPLHYLTLDLNWVKQCQLLEPIKLC